MCYSVTARAYAFAINDLFPYFHSEVKFLIAEVNLLEPSSSPMFTYVPTKIVNILTQLDNPFTCIVLPSIRNIAELFPFVFYGVLALSRKISLMFLLLCHAV